MRLAFAEQLEDNLGAGLGLWWGIVQGCEQVNPAPAPAGFECQPEAEGESAFELGVEGGGGMEVGEVRDERFGAWSWFGGGFGGFE